MDLYEPRAFGRSPSGGRGIIRQAGGGVGIVALLHFFPVCLVLDRTFNPPAGDEVYRVAQMFEGKVIADFADVAFPVLHDLRSLFSLDYFFFELRNHSFVHWEADRIFRPR